MVVVGEELPLEKIQISGTTLSFLLQRLSSSPGDVSGLLFGHVTLLSPSLFSDDATSSPSPPSSSIATITHFLTTPATSSPSTWSSSSSVLIGCFSGRRRSPLRPSLRDSLSLSSLSLSSPSCCVFLLLASPTPSHNTTTTTNSIDTYEYKAYQFAQKRNGNNLVPRALETVNIGPGFGTHYWSFAATSPFPVVTPSGLGEGSSSDFMAEDGNEEKDEMGLDVGVLRGLMGSEAGDYMARLEGVYKGMLERLDQLAMSVHDSSSRVFHKENQNMKLRFKLAGLE